MQQKKYYLCVTFPYRERQTHTMTQSNRDTELVTAVQNGDCTAFAQIVQRYSGQLYALAVRIVGRSDVAEDVVQEAMVKAYGAIDRFRGGCALSSWLYRITYNCAVSQLRKDSRLPYRSDAGQLPDVVDDVTADFSEARILAMQKAVDSLPFDDRTLIHLFYTDDRSVSDCALIMNLSEGNVKTRLSRIRTRLKMMIEKQIYQ